MALRVTKQYLPQATQGCLRKPLLQLSLTSPANMTSELIEFSQLKLYFMLIAMLSHFLVCFRGCRLGKKKANCIYYVHQKNR